MTNQTNQVNREAVTSMREAFRLLGITTGISSQEEINAAFRQRVKAAADGVGGYGEDMDALTQAKAFLSAALAQALEQARIDQSRRLAREEEKQERVRQKARHTPARKPQHTEPLQLGAVPSAHLLRLTWERAQARNRDQARHVRTMWDRQARQQKTSRHVEEPMTTHNHQSHQSHQSHQCHQNQPEEGGISPHVQPPSHISDGHPAMAQALHLLQERQQELTVTCQQEQDLQARLEQTHRQRLQLEQTLQTADVLAEQLCALLFTHENNENSTQQRQPKN